MTVFVSNLHKLQGVVTKKVGNVKSLVTKFWDVGSTDVPRDVTLVRDQLILFSFRNEGENK